MAKALGDTMQQLVFQFEGKKHIVTELFIANDSMLPDDVLYKGRLCLRGDVSGGCPAFSVTRSLMVPHSVTRSLILSPGPSFWLPLHRTISYLKLVSVFGSLILTRCSIPAAPNSCAHFKTQHCFSVPYRTWRCKGVDILNISQRPSQCLRSTFSTSMQRLSLTARTVTGP